MSNISDSAHEIIAEGLRTIGGKQKPANDHIMIICPFHDENTPSCGVYMASGMSLPIGSWHCFGCGEKGSWNRLAEKCGVGKIKEWSTYTTGIQSISIDDEYMTLNRMTRMMNVDANEWPDDMDWRGFTGKLVKRADGIMVHDRQLNSIGVLFPIYIGNSLKGGVKAAYEKQKHLLSYVTTKGNWVAKYGLFGYNIVKKMNKDFFVLVEGPRDALRLISNGIPAIAILGSNNFNRDKAIMLSSLCPEVVFCIADNDEAGSHMRSVVKYEMSKFCKTIAIKLPKDCKDPEKMTKDDILILKEIILSA